jgi:galactitol-specific phosphotransferase system IIC component
MYFATLTADIHTLTFAKMGQYTAEIEAGLQLASWDMGGDPLGFVILNIFKLFGFSV